MKELVNENAYVNELDVDRFFEVVFGEDGRGKIVLKDKLTHKPRLYKTRIGAKKAACRMSLKGNSVYFCVGRTFGESHKAHEVPCLTIAWIDYDCDTDEERLEALDILFDFYPNPSCIVRSRSGYHAYWFLSGLESSGRVERLNCTLRDSIGADPEMRTGSSALLRVPGTLAKLGDEHPQLVEFVTFASGKVYAIEDLEEDLGIDRSDWPENHHSALKLEYDKESGKVLPFSGNDLVQKALVEQSAKKFENVRQPEGTLGKITMSCPFPGRHRLKPGESERGDTNPSAVLFPNGNIYCSACGLNESAQVWTRRPEVRDWAQKLVHRGVSQLHVPKGYFKAPRLGVKEFGPFLFSGSLLGKNILSVRISKDTGQTILNLNEIAEYMRSYSGDLLVRVFWGCVTLAQIDDDDGRFIVSASRIANLLSYNKMEDGTYDSTTRRKINSHLKLLSQLHLKVRLSRNHGSEYNGAIINQVGKVQNRRVFDLHPSLKYQIVNGPAYAPYSHKALELDSITLSFYIQIMWEFSNRHEFNFNKPLLFFLDRIGVPYHSELKSHRGRFIRRWRKILDNLRLKGLLREANLDDGFDLNLNICLPEELYSTILNSPDQAALIRDI